MSHAHTHGHSHMHGTVEPLKAKKPGCSCCGGSSGEECAVSPLARETEEEEAAERQAVKKEIWLLAVSALLFAGALFAQSWIEETFGSIALYALFGVPYVICGASIFKEALELLRAKDFFNEFTLMGVATLAAIAIGELPEAVGVMLFYRIGEFFQDRASAGSRRSIKGLLASKPTIAHLVDGEEVKDEAVENIAVGQLFLVRPGEKIPLDGVVVKGESQVDQSPLTGEPVPVLMAPESAVLGGTINMSGVLTIKATSVFADTHVARILDMVENAALKKSPTERFITRFARYYTPAVVALALLVTVMPPLFVAGQTFETWVYRGLVLLIVSCPCALLISIPLGYFGGIGAASRKGILVKGGTVLDGIMKVDTVVFDKTGTLTKGVFDVTELTPAQGVSDEELLSAACMAEETSNHPIARSIIRYAAAKGFKPTTADAAREIPGKGVAAAKDGVEYLAGSSLLLAERGITVPEVKAHAGGLVHVAKGEQYLGHILVSDVIREETREAVQSLNALGLRTFMLTGDRQEAAAHVAEKAGLGGFVSNLLPEGKVEAMRGLSNASNTAFVGDGINDAPILALSRVGIAMGGIGAQAAIEAADVVILNDSPANVPKLFRIAKAVRSVVWQNIFLALSIKIAFMALGVVGISGLWEAVFADVGVALLAVLNSTRILRV